MGIGAVLVVPLGLRRHHDSVFVVRVLLGLEVGDLFVSVLI